MEGMQNTRAPSAKSDAVASSVPSSSWEQRWLIPLGLLLTVSYQAILCFLDTQASGFAVSPSMVGAAEASIVLLLLPSLFKRLPTGIVVLGLAICANAAFLTIAAQGMEIKALRDVLLPFIFFWLGLNAGNERLVDSTLKVAVVAVLVFGVLEVVALPWFTSIFDIRSYYVHLGRLEEVPYMAADSSLFLSGMRPEHVERTLLPALLGPHRASSIFLEPVSLGNFAAIVAAWGLAKGSDQLRSMVFFVLAAVVMIVMCDSRFSLIAVALMGGLRFLVYGRLRLVGFFAPLAAIAALLLAYQFFADAVVYDNLIGRLAKSGASLAGFDAATLLGLAPALPYEDEGYAYLFSRVGLLLTGTLWLLLWLMRTRDVLGERYRMNISLYIALILCVSGTSLFALKTAGFLWFAMGACAVAAPAEERLKAVAHIG